MNYYAAANVAPCSYNGYAPLNNSGIAHCGHYTACRGLYGLVFDILYFKFTNYSILISLLEKDKTRESINKVNYYIVERKYYKYSFHLHHIVCSNFL